MQAKSITKGMTLPEVLLATGMSAMVLIVGLGFLHVLVIGSNNELIEPLISFSKNGVIASRTESLANRSSKIVYLLGKTWDVGSANEILTQDNQMDIGDYDSSTALGSPNLSSDATTESIIFLDETGIIGALNLRHSPSNKLEIVEVDSSGNGKLSCSHNTPLSLGSNSIVREPGYLLVGLVNNLLSSKRNQAKYNHAPQIIIQRK